MAMCALNIVKGMKLKMNKNFEEIFNSYDRVIRDDVIEKTIIFIQEKYNVCIAFENLKNGNFMEVYPFKLLPQEIKRNILLDLVNCQFSFSHILQNYIKDLIDAKDRYKDDKWYQYDKRELLNTGVIDKIYYDNNGVIKLQGLLGNFTFFSLCNSFIQSNNSIKISPLSDFQAMCFSNTIDMLELNKNGKMSIIQVSSSTNTYLHSVYINDEIVYDLNYYLAYPLQQLQHLYNCKLINEIDYSLWEEMKKRFSYIKPESLIVASSILSNFSDIKSMIDYLDNHENFQSKKNNYKNHRI